MPPRAPPFDLKQVAKLFNDTIAAIRTPEELEPKAIEWLKAARYGLMRDIENRYYELEKGLNNTMLLPAWVDSTHELTLFTTPIPTLLAPYSTAFVDNLLTLLTDCGFNCRSLPCLPNIYLAIRFPAAVAAGEAAEDPPVFPQTLHVDDEFSRLARGAGQGDRKPNVGASAFSATRFGNLVAAARGDTTINAPSVSRKRRRASPMVKQEEESNEQGRRLRSVTRASSTATLRSNAGNGRKRVKRED